MIEAIRINGATEKGETTRSGGEVGRLRAQLFVTQSSLNVEQEALAGFEETKHIRRWVIDGQPELSGNERESSLAEIDRRFAWESDQAKFIGARKMHWDDDRRKNARQRAEEFSDLREQVLQKIEEERIRLSSQIARRAEMADALSEISAREESRYRKDGGQAPPPIFTEREIKELASHAERRGDPQFYRALIRLEQDYDARANHFSWIVNADRVGRAKAREVMAEISAQEAQSRLRQFTEQRERLMVIVKDDGAQNIKLGRIADVEPRTPLERLFRPLMERSEKYRQVAAAVEDYGNQLTRRYERASACHVVLKEAAKECELTYVRQNPGKPAPLPHFTAREIGKLETHAAKEPDLALRARYKKLLSESLTFSRDDSKAQEKSDIRRTIVLDDREATKVFGSAGDENYARDFENRSSNQFDRASMSYDR